MTVDGTEEEHSFDSSVLASGSVGSVDLNPNSATVGQDEAVVPVVVVTSPCLLALFNLGLLVDLSASSQRNLGLGIASNATGVRELSDLTPGINVAVSERVKIQRSLQCLSLIKWLREGCCSHGQPSNTSKADSQFRDMSLETFLSSCLNFKDGRGRPPILRT